MSNIDSKIQDILGRGFEIPAIFKTTLRKESAFTQDEEILDVILLDRTYEAPATKTSSVLGKAKLLLATTHGLILVEEGTNEIDEDVYGFRIKHVLYRHISGIELDICFLQGKLSISGGSGLTETLVEFNTAQYYHAFQDFIGVVRRNMIVEA